MAPTPPQLHLEIRNNTHSGHLVLRCFPTKCSEFQVSLSSSSLHVQTDEKCVYLRLPPEVRTAPSSCRSLQYVAADGLHMRLQVETDSLAELVPTAMKSLAAQMSFIFQCQTCGQSLLKKQIFRRVLPLPNGNWSDLVEHWCCHPDPFAKKLEPKEDDCLLGDTFMLVNVADVDETAVQEVKTGQSEVSQLAGEIHSVQKPKGSHAVVCTRCRKMLGEFTASETMKFYVTEVLVQPVTDQGLKRNMLKRSVFVESVVAGRLMELSSAQSTFRFCIQGHDGKTYILLWLLNSDTLLVRSHVKPDVCDFCEPNKRIAKPGLSFKSYGANNAIKVLYHSCLKGRNKDIRDTWEKNIGVHSLILPVNTCLELLLILAASTASLPSSLRSMNSFKCHGIHLIQAESQFHVNQRTTPSTM
ncbi:E3 ubiquitin-protein ligase E3D isoform X2 [Callorhinchus milii]|uniref:E3 ubiquitin-protein ligase E3D isoform X2 n=1 Tax=Callorhinchus milii TaxID=7868 RepID=UPI001C3FA498|nr:E3 ubiquitin-protein ligase E3D isoform X2 [Callorhinchus milii]